MIGYLQGKLLDKDLNRAILDVGGVGYVVSMPIPDLAKLGAPGAAVKVHVHTRVREDAIDLFAFLEGDSLSLFEKLVAVNGVGPRTALAVLSGMEPARLIEVVTAGDEAALVKIPNVGKKTAARIVLELSDKLAKEGITSKGAAPVANDLDDLKSALENLGYKPTSVDRALKAVKPLREKGASLEELVKEALRHV
jgi:Holliday junction DNA helicase RuvA